MNTELVFKKTDQLFPEGFYQFFSSSFHKHLSKYFRTRHRFSMVCQKHTFETKCVYQGDKYKIYARG